MSPTAAKAAPKPSTVTPFARLGVTEPQNRGAISRLAPQERCQGHTKGLTGGSILKIEPLIIRGGVPGKHSGGANPELAPQIC